MTIGNIKTDIEGIKAVISPMGEGDPIRWAQGMPGVTTGADGTTSMYVRGGNAGNNMFTLDGVPVYGYSHILGLTTIIPNDVIDDVSLAVVHDAVEADAFGDDRCRDIFVIHLASLSLELGVGLAACLVDVVLDDGLLIEAVVALEDCLRHLSGVGLEGEEFREVTLDEELELVLVEELHVVLHDL